VTLARREFLRSARQAAVGACLLGARGALPMMALGCASVPYVRGDRRDDEVHLPFTALDKDGRALVEVPGLDLPIFVRRVPGTPAVALSTRCMHRGCEVEPSTDRLVCPCHGSEYALDGAVLEGPTELPLERFRVRELSDGLVIELATRGNG
jgi:Rieske Fe-S protein